VSAPVVTSLHQSLSRRESEERHFKDVLWHVARVAILVVCSEYDAGRHWMRQRCRHSVQPLRLGAVAANRPGLRIALENRTNKYGVPSGHLEKGDRRLEGGVVGGCLIKHSHLQRFMNSQWQP
jgi:hypothetical protein